MGGDGGSIPKRIELVRSRQKPEQIGKEAELAARWLHCQLSQERLQRPIVACQLGRMYNKTAVLEFLLDRDKFGADSAFGHVRALRDVRELRLADNPECHPEEVAKKGTNAAASAFGQAPPFACPLSGVEMNGRFRFVFPWACGCVLAEKALERMNKSGSTGSRACPVCQKAGALEDLVQLNPTGEAEVAAAAEAMENRRKRQKAAADSVRGSKRKAAQQDVPSGAASSSSTKVARPAPSGSRPAAPAAVIGASSSNSGTGSVQNNPNASAAFKSLFTSSKEAKSQAKAHWVTFNPGYFR